MGITALASSPKAVDVPANLNKFTLARARVLLRKSFLVLFVRPNGFDFHGLHSTRVRPPRDHRCELAYLATHSCVMARPIWRGSIRPAFRTQDARMTQRLCLRSLGRVSHHKSRAARRERLSRLISGVPDGIRTRVTAVKGRCPRPLDDGDAALARLNLFYATNRLQLVMCFFSPDANSALS
jgi:hypothetical protein